ncbi:hypothetical protein [Streptomyces sp. NBC_01304]|uniref:hypothetical protein n=1 Tax=Streptomyces sp. NBC_01304 TaxID=2903818 RepID=UPI002E1555F3|nr:hypothetical protein OG430_01460 [Streptomyces sp. NBC_01304]
MAINAIYRNAEPAEKGWQRAAFALFFVNLLAILVTVNVAGQAWDACGVSDDSCRDAVLSANDASNWWIFAACTIGMVAAALPARRQLRTWRIVLMASECAAMVAQTLVYP